MAKSLLDLLFNFQDDDNFEKETVEFTKNNIKSTVDIFFDKNGRLISLFATSEYIPSPDEERLNRIELLNKKILIAVEKEDYESASLLKRERDMLENQQ